MGKRQGLWVPRYPGVLVFWLVTGAHAQAAIFTVNTPSDAVDAIPGDGVCETAPGNAICTLRGRPAERINFRDWEFTRRHLATTRAGETTPSLTSEEELRRRDALIAEMKRSLGAN